MDEKEGTAGKNEYLEKALHANEEKAQGLNVSDLFNPESTIYKEEKKEEEKPKEKVQEEAPKFDAEGFPIIPKVHTFKEDLSNVIKYEQLSMSKIAMMEGGKEKKEEEKPKNKPKIALILFISSLGLIGLTIVGLFIFSSLKKQDEIVPIVTKKAPKEIMFSEEKQRLDITKTTKTELRETLKRIEKNMKANDNVINVELITLVDEKQKLVTTKELFGKVGARIPEVFSRYLNDKFYLGIYGKQQKRIDPFLIVFTSSYDYAFPSLLDWEGYMQDDFDWLFDTKIQSKSTTTKLAFKDRVIVNKDARSFEDGIGNTAFFYSFLDSNTIIFARTSDTVREVIDRMREAKLR